MPITLRAPRWQYKSTKSHLSLVIVFVAIKSYFRWALIAVTSLRNRQIVLSSPSRLMIALLLLFAFGAPELTAAPVGKQYGILFITSIDPEQPGVSSLLQEARAEIQDQLDRPVRFSVEYLDPQLFVPAKNNQDKTAAFLRAKYSRQSFDLVLAIGPQAFTFAEKYEPRLFPRASLASLLIGPIATGSRAAVPLFRISPEFVPTLEAALAQNRGTQEVVLVAGSSATDKLLLQQAREDLESYAPGLQFRELTDTTLDQLKSKLAQVGPHSVVLFIDFTMDSTGEEYIGARVLPMLSLAAARPMYGIFNEQVGNGIVGGDVVDMRAVGSSVGGTMLRVLRGEKPEPILFRGSAFQHLVFDERQMRRWRIRQVPADSTILYQEYRPWEIYRWRLIGLSLAVFLETILIVLLLRTSAQRKRAERNVARMLAVERLESSLAASLLHRPATAVKTEIDRGFRQFIQFFRIDCISLYECDEDARRFSLLHYRTARGTPLRLARLAAEEFKWTTDKLLRGQTVVVRTRADVPQEATAVVAALVRSGLHSFAGVPLTVDKRVVGALFFASSRNFDWDAALLEQLKLMANIVGSGLERVRSQSALTESEQLKTAILASLSSSTAVLDSEGNVIAVNVSPMPVPSNGNFGQGTLRLGVNYFDICRRAGESGSEYARLALHGLQDVCAKRTNHFEMEYPCTTGQNCWCNMSAVPLIGKSGGVVVSHTDVSRRKRAEVELQETQNRFRLMTDSAPVLVWTCGPDRKFTDFNKRWLQFTGSTVADEVGEGWKRGIYPDDRKHYSEVTDAAFRNLQPFKVEYRFRRHDGEYRWMVDRGVPRFRPDGAFAGYIGCSADVTDQKEAEAARAEIGGRLLLAQEQERIRIARELHDDINQKLGLLAIDIQRLQQRLRPEDDLIATALGELFRKTDRISGDVQRLSHQLHSSRLDYLGVPAALRKLCEEFAAQHHIFVECAVNDLPGRLVRETGLCLFRIAQECLSNAVKHGSATHVRVQLQYDKSSVRLDVTDNGSGFSLQQVNARQDPGLGLISMRERLRLVNGELSIDSQQGAGTRITAIVPLKLDTGVVQFPRKAV